MKRLQKFIDTCIIACFTGYISAYAAGDASVIFQGEEYTLDSNTILLDREGLYGEISATKDAAEAFRQVNEAGGSVTLLIAPSVYWLDDPDDPGIRTDKEGTPFAVRVKCDTLRIIGLAENPEEVVLAVNRGQTQGAIGNFTMFEFDGRSLETENITFGNYCNIDLEYPRNPQYNRQRRKDAIVQAQIGICRSTDRLYADNCRFLSRLNLCPFIGARRSLYENCYFECTDDALSGSGIYWRCSFTFFSSKPFYSTDKTGAVFLNCDIHSKCSGTQYFTKVSGPLTVIDTRFTGDSPIDILWTRDASDTRCYQHNITLNGKPYIIDAARRELGPELAGKHLMDAYRIEYEGTVYYNLPNLTNGNDEWDPAGMNGIIAEIENATGRKLTGIPVALEVTATPGSLKATGDTATISTTSLLWGGFAAGGSSDTQFISDNHTPRPLRQIVRHTTSSGLEGAVSIDLNPNLRKAPKVKKTPKIYYDKRSGQYTVEYALTGKGEDDSTIIWDRIWQDSDGQTHHALVKSSKGKGAKYYKAKAGDYFCKIVAAVLPKYTDSESGEIRISETEEVSAPERIAELPESTLITDFSDIPILERQPGMPGVWSFDIYKPEDTEGAEWEAESGSGWAYGKGYDASTGIGLIQTEKGARLSYLPLRDACQDMEVTLTVEPAKIGGQGFGSATYQYMDICVKFDPVSLNGYALRIERTADHDRAVRFSLIRYTNGKTEVINPGVISNCYRTPCHITVGIKDGILRATALTEAVAATTCCEETLPSADISAIVEESQNCGFCIQHTGSTGPSSTLIKNVNINWK